MACSSCGGKKNTPDMRAALVELQALYVTKKSGRRGYCPVDGTRATLTWYRKGSAKIAYRKCQNGHAIPA